MPTKNPSIPPARPSSAAHEHFRAATNLLKQHTPVPPRRTFPEPARDIRGLAEILIAELENPTSLEAVDRAALILGQKCLEVQRLTLKARAAGAR